MKPARLAITALLLQLFIVNAYSQEAQVIDQVVAVVGGEHILLSDIEQEFLRQKMEGSPTGENNRCNVLEQILIQKLLLTQAKIDSLKTNESSVEMEIDRRLKYFTSQLGSEKALESYFNKPIYEVKNDLREAIGEQLLTQQMRQKIVDKVKITPAEVKSFYKNIPTDSLPTVPEQYELQQKT